MKSFDAWIVVVPRRRWGKRAVMCGDAQASPKCEPCDPELAGAGESVEEASVPHAAAPADEDKLKHRAWAYLLENADTWRLADQHDYREW